MAQWASYCTSHRFRLKSDALSHVSLLSVKTELQPFETR